MEQSRFWEANSSSAIQEFPWILWNPEFHYHVHNSLTIFPFLTQISLHPFHSSRRPILILSAHLRVIIPSDFFLSSFPSKPYMRLFYPTYVQHGLPIMKLLVLRLRHLNEIWNKECKERLCLICLFCVSGSIGTCVCYCCLLLTSSSFLSPFLSSTTTSVHAGLPSTVSPTPSSLSTLWLTSGRVSNC